MQVLVYFTIGTLLSENCSYEHELEVAKYFVCFDSKLVSDMQAQDSRVRCGLSCQLSPYCKVDPSLL